MPTSSLVLARNATLNLVTEGWIFIILLFVMPKLVFFMGDASFGLFSLAWVLIGYLAFLDIGVSRAATMFISQRLVVRDLESASEIVRTALAANLVLGIVGGLAVAILTPYAVHSVFTVSPNLQEQARWAFYAVGLAVPALLLQGVCRAVLSSFQRFGWINAVNGLATMVQWGLAVMLAWRGYSVALIVFSTVLTRNVATVVYYFLIRRLLPNLQLFRAASIRGLTELLQFGSWVTVSQLVSPLLVYLDRILIASFMSLAEVTLYTVPYEAMTRLRVIPSSLAATLYPAFSERGRAGHEERFQWLYGRSLRYLLMLVLPGVLFLLVFGKDVLSLWMGESFAKQTATVLQILALGALANAVAYVPYNALQAFGRPDLTGKFHLCELPLYVFLCVVLIPRMGIAGAALTSSVRFGLDAFLLFWAAQHHCSCDLRVIWEETARVVLSGGLFGVTLVAIHVMIASSWPRVGVGLLAMALYFLGCWRLVVSAKEKPLLTRMLAVTRHESVS